MEKIVQAHRRLFTEPGTRIGATYVPSEGTHVRLWAPNAQSAEIEWQGREPVSLNKEDGYHTGFFPDAKSGDRYFFRLDGKTRIADPASRFQPEDTHGPSEVAGMDFAWTDATWRGVPFSQWVIYEIHPGTFSPGHDFDGIIADLPRLKDLGVTTLEILPVSQFSGDRNWGYDGVFPHAVQHSYGGPQKLKALVDACHAHGLAIILDVVLNHIGPEANVLFGCGPYVSDKYKTPWGPALNFDGPESDNVRRYFLQAAWQWLTEYHFDGLRLDAVQMIFDASPLPLLEELSRLTREAETVRGLPLVLTAESDMNDARLIAPVDRNGMGIDAQWADDFHHCLHVLLTDEKGGYYVDYGGVKQLAHIYRCGVAFEGEYSPYRKRRHGRSYESVELRHLIVETQNHDQTGNRLLGERLISVAGYDKAKLGAACVLLSPFTPLLFMGEELAAEQPFQYFISHHDPVLVDAVRKGRAEEWKDFSWSQEPSDPAAPETFEQCVLRDKKPAKGSQAADMQDYYRELIALSKTVRDYGRPAVQLDEEHSRIELMYEGEDRSILVIFSFNAAEHQMTMHGQWRAVLQSSGAIEGKADINEGMIAVPPYSAIVLESRVA
jgi:maltooligosyltrehalose trehalohydrolase